ncbi:MAG: hypothetical protein K1X74_09765 [Pirellulales bacterium]|nr:hypothetical protein [Pirellulales bacterium]
MLTCQRGAEGAVKHELAARYPHLRLSFSRPGFLTFKLPAEHSLPDDFALASVFARTNVFSLGRAEGDDDQLRAATAWAKVADLEIAAVHVWQRDLAEPGAQGYEPAPTELADAVHRQLLSARPPGARGTEPPADQHEPLAKGMLVLDCILVEPAEWWCGFHRTGRGASRTPGGLRRYELPPTAVSRAYLKMVEGLRWSRLPVRSGQVVVEIGSAPGGSSQALLDRGLRVIGVDPAAMHPDVLAQPNFRHLQLRGAEIPKRELREVRWLTADLNVAPQYTLDTVESIVTNARVNIRGLLLTLKLLDWSLAAELPAYLERIRGWGFADVRARQLQMNRQEVCVAALRRAPRDYSRRSAPA